MGDPDYDLIIIITLCVVSILSNAVVLLSYLFDKYYLDKKKSNKKIFPRFVANLCLSMLLGEVCVALGRPEDKSILCNIQAFGVCKYLYMLSEALVIIC